MIGDDDTVASDPAWAPRDGESVADANAATLPAATATMTSGDHTLNPDAVVAADAELLAGRRSEVGEELARGGASARSTAPSIATS